MKPSDVKVCVLRMEGTNCEDEMADAFRMVGAKAELVHLNQLSGSVPADMKRKLEDYDALAFPGGFSAGDYIRAGAIFAARVRSAVGKDLVKFVDAGKPVLGVCNGFQILVELGLLPAFDSTMSDVPTAALYTNESARFECRWTKLRNDNRGKCIFTSHVPAKKILTVPVAHGEGRLMSMDPRFVDRLEENDQVVFRYVNPDGSKAVYPWNPNGSPSDIAGICNPAGNVMGMMPHPERVMSRFTHPDWTRGYDSEKGDGLPVFESVMSYLTKK
ncbi:MAG: phosphoribosylformylglycinamidine synthase subunit PurQ [Candidatus Methanomethylophilaceae archaeon]|nr:phosphoribosylformylglycinamidine synthase subunit PurQ [Candidatus Methanomethylophilaceae archaeon]